MNSEERQRIVVVGAGPVGSLAALYAAARGDDVEIYELRGGEGNSSICLCFEEPAMVLLLSLFLGRKHASSNDIVQ